MSDTPAQPKIAQRSPFVIDETPGKRFFCACGLSAKQPYCDGSHKGTGLAPIVIEVTQDGKVAYCGCKRSGNLPFCDGSHRSLPAEA